MFVRSESMHFLPPSPIKPQHRTSIAKKSTEVRPEAAQVEPVKPAGRTRYEESNRRSDHCDKQQHRPQRPTGCMDVLTNLLGCRGSEAVGSVLVPVARADGGGAHKKRGREGYVKDGDRGNFRKTRGSDRGGNKPVGAPNCSQCGRRFNPEKLHSHMKSCKALKARAKGSSSFVEAATFRTESNRTTEQSSQEFSRESVAGLLT